MKQLTLFFILAFSSPAFAELSIQESASQIVISNGDKHVLTYHKSEVEPPEGVSKVFRRSAFIHPLTAPNGGVVTSIHAPDHYHHLGLWHAWVKTKHKGRKIDFWNLKAAQGTVRYAKTKALRRDSGTVGFTVEQHHLLLPDEIILKEEFSIEVQVQGGTYLVDHVTEQVNVSDAPLELPKYRYGGNLAYRGPLHWNNENSSLLTSEGKTRKDGHESRAHWCRFTGPTDPGTVTVTIMGHPGNHDAPQRQRIWPPTSHDGAVFYNWVPIQETAWALEPGQPSIMKYRIVLSNGEASRASIDGWFEEYK